MSSQTFAHPLSFREDLKNKLTSQLCQNQDLLFSQKAFFQGIYDTQIYGIKIYSPEAPSAHEFETLISKYQQAHYHGVSFASCPQAHSKGRKHKEKTLSWLLFTPAPTAWNGDLTKTIEQQKPYCKKTEAHWLAANQGTAHPISALPYALPQNINGTLSITCWPIASKQIGPKLWYLLPLGKGPLDQAPLSSATTPLVQWINAIRQKEGLDSLKFDNPIWKRAAESLMHSGNIEHNQNDNQHVAHELAQKGLVFMGEERSIGQTEQEMAWLLWNSPRHRQLLLHPSAEWAGLAIKKISPQNSIMVLLMGKSSGKTMHKEKNNDTLSE